MSLDTPVERHPVAIARGRSGERPMDQRSPAGPGCMVIRCRNAILTNVEIGIATDCLQFGSEQTAIVLRDINREEVPRSLLQIGSAVTRQRSPIGGIAGIAES